MLIRKILTGTMTAAAVVAFTSWASVAAAAVSPADVAAALDPSKTLAQQTAEIRALAQANPNDPDISQLAQLVADQVSQDQAASFAGALGAACGAAANNAQTTQSLVSIWAGKFPDAGGTIVGALIAQGCSAEVAANTLQATLLSAAGQFLGLREVLKAPNPGPGVNPNQEAFVKSFNTDRLGNRRGVDIQPFVPQEGAMSPTSFKDKQPEYTPPETPQETD